MEDKEGKKQERGFAFWGAVISLILSALSIVLVVMEQYGVTLPGIMPDIMSWSLVWLPILCGVTGVFIGWYARDKKAQDEIKALEEQHGAELAKAETEHEETKATYAAEVEGLQTRITELEQQPKMILGMTLEEAAELLGKEKQQQIEALDRDESELLSSSVGQQLICLTAWNSHRNSKTISRKFSEIYALYGQKECESAVESGFVRLEPCGVDSVRIVATPKLVDLMQNRPDAYAKLLDLCVRVAEPEWERDWRSVTFNEDGTFSLLGPKEDEEIDITLFRFKEEYRRRPFWQRLLIQSLVYGEKLAMLGDQYKKFIAEDFTDREAFIEIRQKAGNLYELKATETIKKVYIAIPDLFESVDPEPYIDEVPEYLSADFSKLITCDGVEWYQEI